MGACDRPAPTPVTPQVSTPPRPLMLKLQPNTASSLFFRLAVISSRHRLEHAIVLSPWKPKAYSACARIDESVLTHLAPQQTDDLASPPYHAVCPTDAAAQTTHHLNARDEVVHAQAGGEVLGNLHTKRGPSV